MNESTESTAISHPDKDKLEDLRLNLQLREFHHRALWEEEKHFTWLFSVVVAAQIAILAKKPDDMASRPLVLIVLAVLGLAFVVIAIVALRREGAYFAKANRTCTRLYNHLFPDYQFKMPPSRDNTPLALLPLRLVMPWRMSVRDAFQIIFLVFGAVFLGILILASLGMV